MKRLAALFLSLMLSATAAYSETKRTLFDSHSHYGLADTQNFTPAQILNIFDTNQIAYALISSTPNSGTENLYKAAPDRIIPFLGLYQTLRDKRDWMYDESVIDLVENNLKTGIYRGIGELHIFEKDRKSPVLKRIVEIASERGLMLQVHGDKGVIDEIFTIAPNVTVLWAHLGTRPHPWVLRAALEKHPNNLYIDTSVRDKQLLMTGGLTPMWKELFIDFQDRFMVAIDTFSVNRWNTYDLVVKDIHDWLDDLPEEVAAKIAYENAYNLLIKTESKSFLD